MSGVLYLVPTPLGRGASPIPLEVQRTVCELDGFIAESAKNARQFLKAIGYPRPLAEVPIQELNEHTPAAMLGSLLGPVRAGKRIGVVSDAGSPAVADPGSTLVALAHREGLRVVPLVGPSAILLALMASGLEGQRFCFHGYVPVEREACALALRALEARSAAERSTQIFIEAPYRNDRLLKILLDTCRDETLLCIATDLTLPRESIATKSVLLWRQATPQLDRRPSVFLLQGTALR